jgi:hypothetical protein
VDCLTHAPLAAGGAPISAAESVHLVLTCLGGAAPFGFKGAGFDSLCLRESNQSEFLRVSDWCRTN